MRPILLLFNKSLSDGVLPERSKTSYIFPIFKSGDRSDIENYCPISILSYLAKVIESIITRKLCDFLLMSICLSQHGFVRGRSVLMNLLLYNDIIFEASKSKSQVSVYFNYSKAFMNIMLDRCRSLCPLLFCLFINDLLMAIQIM